MAPQNVFDPTGMEAMLLTGHSDAKSYLRCRELDSPHPGSVESRLSSPDPRGDLSTPPASLLVKAKEPTCSTRYIVIGSQC